MWIGCHADSHEYARWFGDDIAVRHDSYFVDWSGAPYRRFLLKNLGRGFPTLPKRAQLAAQLLMDARGNIGGLVHSHCMSASLLAEEIGLGVDVCEALPYAYERWDGSGLPAGASGDQIPVAMRVAQLADIAEVTIAPAARKLRWPKSTIEGARSSIRHRRCVRHGRRRRASRQG